MIIFIMLSGGGVWLGIPLLNIYTNPSSIDVREAQINPFNCQRPRMTHSGSRRHTTLFPFKCTVHGTEVLWGKNDGLKSEVQLASQSID
jgi:hypothetical protein